MTTSQRQTIEWARISIERYPNHTIAIVTDDELLMLCDLATRWLDLVDEEESTAAAVILRILIREHVRGEHDNIVGGDVRCPMCGITNHNHNNTEETGEHNEED